ncbi:MAG TPA: hypothetical protein VJT09_02300 [Pyrinomonadaceae bacterium]|nr:hypothetical protein [Pyrinomonadaceae bacterium]
MAVTDCGEPDPLLLHGSFQRSAHRSFHLDRKEGHVVVALDNNMPSLENHLLSQNDRIAGYLDLFRQVQDVGELRALQPPVSNAHCLHLGHLREGWGQLLLPAIFQ